MIGRACRRTVSEHEDRRDAERRLQRLDAVLAEAADSDAGAQATLG